MTIANHRLTRRAAMVAGVTALLAGSASAQDLTFGFVPTSLIYPINAAVAKGFSDAAAAAGVEAVVIDPRGSIESQSNAIDDLIAQGVDGIGFLPLDSVIAEAFVERANGAEIPIVSVAVQVGDPIKRDLRDVFPGLAALVAPDAVFEGEQSGKLSLELLPKDRLVKIAIVEGAPGYAVVQQRSEGFIKALDDAGLQYEIVGSQPSDWTPESGEAICQNFLTSTPDLDLVFTQADDMALGCARAISAAGAATHLVATSGGSALGNAAIEAGELAGSVCVRPELMGRLMFEKMYAAATDPAFVAGEFVTMDEPIITKETLVDCPPEW